MQFAMLPDEYALSKIYRTTLGTSRPYNMTVPHEQENEIGTAIAVCWWAAPRPHIGLRGKSNHFKGLQSRTATARRADLHSLSRQNDIF
jgi:hypothetical protein